MKKRLIIIACLFFLGMLFTGCSGKNLEPAVEQSEQQTAQQPADENDIEAVEVVNTELSTAVAIEEQNELPPYQAYRFNEEYYEDINGDGIEDSIRFALKDGEEGAALKVNDRELILGFDPFIITEAYRIVDIDVSDSYREIVVCSMGPSNDPDSTFYYYDGSSIGMMGAIEGNLKNSPYNSDVFIDGSGRLIAPKRLQVLNGLSCKETYTLDEQHMLVVENSNRSMYAIDYTVTIKENPINAYIERNTSGSFYKINPGEIISMVETDNKQWIGAYWGNKRIWVNINQVASEQFLGIPFFD